MIKLPKFPRKWRQSLAIVALLGLLAAGPGAYLLLHHPNQAQAAWFDSRWGFRQAITLTVTSSASDITKLQTLVTINTSTLITAGKLQSACQDLRFTSNVGVALPYYIDSGCNTTATKVWVQADLVPKNTTSYVLYMYYGNNSAVAGSDQSATYNFNLVKGLVAYYTMNDSSWNNNCSTATVTDSSVNGNNGLSCANASGLTGGVAGQFGNGASLGGWATNQYISIPNSTALANLTGDVTFSMWLKPGTTQVAYTDIFSKHSAGSYVLEQNNGTTNQYYFAWDINGAGAYTCNTTYFNLTPSVWQHLVVDKSGATANYYVNGTSIGSCTGSSATIVNNSLPLFLGNWSSGGGRNWTGNMDDFRIYNRALSVAEVTQLYNYTGSITTTVPTTIVSSTAFASEENGPVPVLYYKFDEGTSTIAHDSSYSNNPGTLNNNTNVTWLTEDQCISGKCLQFDGTTNGYVQANSSNSLNTGSAITIEMWIKPKNLTNSNILTKWDTGTNQRQFALQDSGGLPTFAVSNNGLYSSLNQLTANTSLVANQWQHIVVTWSAGVMTFYRNGNYDGGGTTPATTLYPGTTLLEIAKAVGGGAGANFAGNIDEVKIFNYARTQAQVKVDFNQYANRAGYQIPMALNNGLVGYWKMDEASWNGTAGEVVDSSTAGNSGTGGASVTTGAGKFGLGGVFNGTTQYVSVANNATLNLTTNITAAAWIYPTTISGAAEIINKKTDAGLSGYRLRRSGGTIIFEYSDGVTARIAVTSSVKLVANQWQHVAATYDGQKVRIFYNGAQVYEEAHTTAMVTNSSVLYLGAYNALNAYWWAGTLDEVRLYNRALAPAEITQLYNFAPGPVGWWKFDNGSGTSVTDSGSAGNTGTWNGTGSPHWVFGKLGYAGNFNGTDDYITMGTPTNLGLSGNQSYTLSAWINPTTTRLDGAFISYGSSITSNVISITSNGGAIESVHYSNDYAFGTVWSLGVWQYVTIAYDASADVEKLYVNGVFKQQWNPGALALTAGQNLYIGRSSWNNTNTAQTKIDDVKIYNYARTQTQIQDDMRGISPITPVLSLLSGSATGSARIRGATPIGYWKFNEGYGTLVNNSGSAGTQLNGLLSNFSSPSTSTSGWQPAASGLCKLNKCLAFNGTNNFVTMIDNNSVANSTGDISFSAWVRPTALDGAQHDVLFKAQGATNSLRNYGLRLNSSNQWQAVFYVSGTEYSAVATGITPSTTNWSHLVGVKSGSNGYLYVNGILAGSIGISGTMNTNNASVIIGNLNGASEYFSGLVQEVKIYDFGLNQDQVNADYNYGSSLTEGGVLGTLEASNDLLDTAGAPPVAYYNFNENTGLTVNDSSGNANNGSWAGFPSNQWAPGKFGSGAGFNGVDNIQVNSSSSLNLSTYTVGFWVKSGQAPSTANVQQVFSKAVNNTDGSANYIFSWSHTTSAFEQACAHSVSGAYPAAAKLTSTLNANTWYYITCSYDGTNLKAYLNGQLQATTAIASPDTGNFNFYIGTGQNSNNPTAYFNGTVDDFKIYNYARTQAQIAYDYNRGGPMAWWKFDENQGTTVNDSSGTSTSQTGTWNGTLGSQWGTGKINTAGVFNGTNNYVAGNGPSLSNSNFSIAGWIYQNPSPSGSQDWFNLGSSGTTDNAIVLRVTTAGGGLFAFYGDDLTIPSGSFHTGVWQHAVYTYNATTKLRTVYINGVPIVSGVAAGNFVGNNIYSIAASFGVSLFWNGKIDDLRIYNYQLSQNQINKIYNNGALDYGPSSGTP